MVKLLSSSAQKVQDAIFKAGYDFTVIETEKVTRTAQEAADAAGCALGQIVKSLVFKGDVSEKPILVLTSGTNRVNEKGFRELIGEKITRADPDFVRNSTGFAIGGIPPLAHNIQIETYMDKDLMNHTTVWAAAGTPNAIFELPPAVLILISNAKLIDIK